MQWPQTPTCHTVDSLFLLGKTPTWRPGRVSIRYPNGEPFRTCSYCGSIHPEDLLTALNTGATLEMADMKYGWPHKFYVEIPNKHADEQCEVGMKYEDGKEIPIRGKQGNFTAKWYSEHLLDEGYDSNTINTLLTMLSNYSPIRWKRGEDGRLKWSR